MEINHLRQAARIQTSILNAAEKKALVWIAQRQPEWVTSDFLSFIGFIGSLTTGIGYALAGYSPAFLWLASFGLVINWYGDSLDGTLARVRNAQRPVYGFYIDHTLDCISELLIFAGLGLSPLMDMRIALLILLSYFLITINVTIDTHLKSEFRLTYAKLGPTEFRIVAIALNLILIFSPSLREFTTTFSILGQRLTMTLLDVAGLAVFAIIMLMYGVTVMLDAKGYAESDPKKQ